MNLQVQHSNMQDYTLLRIAVVLHESFVLMPTMKDH